MKNCKRVLPCWKEAGGWKEIHEAGECLLPGPGMSGLEGVVAGVPSVSGPPQGSWGKPQDGWFIVAVEGIGSWGGSGSVRAKLGWSGVARSRSAEPTGWENPPTFNPTPKMEIDGPAPQLEGDPGACKAVNLWDRNNPEECPQARSYH
ncbi:trinucleotide repeat-containing gene 6C protein-like protein [Lates japonicus]|uniref:Trinucleotide repeat-containing gene 6C protein-like protein n=1 Tax=Lates japonicus TaxID=270547 RepID=A0AAD3N6P4_LATJO|nr:trinucleotide repeat-containing gene 6C protein-like protein [Lates japonicus]